MSPNPIHERHLDVVKEAISAALRWQELSKAAAIELAARVIRSRAILKRSYETLARLNRETRTVGIKPAVDAQHLTPDGTDARAGSTARGKSVRPASRAP